jgi:Uma2 family endonuclease
MSTNPKQFTTPEEYLEIDRASEERYEYFDGEMFLMSVGSARHNSIIFNIGGSLRAQTKGGRCRGFANSQRVLIDETGLYTYPDVIIVCGQPVFAHGDTLVNPTLLVEVLSPSTGNYDKVGKFDHYRKIASLAEYILVAQDKPHVMRYVRHEDATWLLSETTDINASVALPSINWHLTLSDVYDNVDFTESQGTLVQ